MLMEELFYCGEGLQKFLSMYHTNLKMSNSSNSYEGPNLICYRFSKGRKWKRKYTNWNVHILIKMKFPEKKNQSLCYVNLKYTK